MHKSVPLKKCSHILSIIGKNCNSFWNRENCKSFRTSYLLSNSVTGQGLSSRGSRKNTNAGDVIENSVVPVKMAYTSYESTTSSKDSEPIVIMHGLLGSKSNWNSLSKAIHNQTKKKVIAVDARNHGESPHTVEHTYNHLAADVKALLMDLSISQANMIGHSMGGRTMMLVALRYPEIVKKLCVVDISPIGSSPSLKHMVKYFEAMKLVKLEPKLPLSTARKSADSQLSSYISDPGLRQFIITNLVEGEGGHYKWRVNLDSITKNFVNNISGFPNVGSSVYNGPTLFIGGGNSDYLRREDEEAIKKFFPKAKFTYIPDAGHWVHADKPQEFLNILMSFIQNSTS